eukprot:scaffold238674_cov21-Prasinocladus_malaysianus.AAC.1
MRLLGTACAAVVPAGGESAGTSESGAGCRFCVNVIGATIYMSSPPLFCREVYRPREITTIAISRCMFFGYLEETSAMKSNRVFSPPPHRNMYHGGPGDG